jgi:hypothetical protein
MRVLILILSLISINAAAETSYDDLKPYYHLKLDELPQGTILVFLQDFLVPRGANNYKFGKLTTGEVCEMVTPPKNVDRIILHDTEKPLFPTPYGRVNPQLTLNATNSVFIYCQRDTTTLGDFIEALGERFTFKIPMPAKPEIFEF